MSKEACNLIAGIALGIIIGLVANSVYPILPRIILPAVASGGDCVSQEEFNVVRNDVESWKQYTRELKTWVVNNRSPGSGQAMGAPLAPDVKK